MQKIYPKYVLTYRYVCTVRTYVDIHFFTITATDTYVGIWVQELYLLWSACTVSQ